MNLQFYLAQKLFSERKNSGTLGKISNSIAIFSVAISITVIIVSIAISSGFRKEIEEKSAGYTGDMFISPAGVELYNSEYPCIINDSSLKHIESSSLIKNIQPVAYTQGLFKSSDEIEGIVLKGIDSTYDKSFLSKHIIEGTIPIYNGDTTSNFIIISSALKNTLNLNVGDKIDAFFVKNDVKVRRFTISGIYATGLEEMDKLLVYADIKHAQKLNGWKKDYVSGYELLLNENARPAKNHKEEVEELLLNTKLNKLNDEDEVFSDSLMLTTVEEQFYNLFDWLHLIDLNVIIILVLMIAVAGFNMISGVLILLFERMSQIGLLKALGMVNSSIINIFLYSGAKLILSGMVIGNVFALVLCYLQKIFEIIPLDPASYFVNHVPISISLWQVFIVNAILLGAILIILLIPLHFISRISPAKTLVVK